MSDLPYNEFPHRRYNPLTQSWVLVSPHRSKRPWQGQVEKTVAEERPAHDPSCYLCAGNIRSNGEINPDYTDVFAFTNDFSALLEHTPAQDFNEGELYKAKSESGICRVVCFSPRHDLTIPEMTVASVRKVVDLWIDEYRTLGAHEDINHIQIFENKGFIMGCSNPHPHGQIWAQSSIPDEPLKKQAAQERYYQKHSRTILQDYVQSELEKGVRVIFKTGSFVALVPFWAIWPFEAMILPLRPVSRITELDESERADFAAAYRQLAIVYDNLFETSFPYSAGIHQAPSNGALHPEWHLHMSFLPPLLRSATVKKFMVGYEMLANPQRDITPEKAAETLKRLPLIHYKTPAGFSS